MFKQKIAVNFIIMGLAFLFGAGLLVTSLVQGWFVKADTLEGFNYSAPDGVEWLYKVNEDDEIVLVDVRLNGRMFIEIPDIIDGKIVAWLGSGLFKYDCDNQNMLGASFLLPENIGAEFYIFGHGSASEKDGVSYPINLYFREAYVALYGGGKWAFSQPFTGGWFMGPAYNGNNGILTTNFNAYFNSKKISYNIDGEVYTRFYESEEITLPTALELGAPDGLQYSGWALSEQGASIGDTIDLSDDMVLYALAEPDDIDDPAPIEPEPTEPIIPTEPIVPTEPIEPVYQPKDKKKASPWLWVGIFGCLLITGSAGGSGYVYYDTRKEFEIK